MKYQRLTKWVAARIAMYMGILVLIGAINLFLHMKQTSLTLEGDALRGQVGSVNAQLADLHKKAAEVAKAAVIWKNLPAQYKENTGLKIDAAKQAITSYAKEYDIQIIEFHLSSPVLLAGEYKTDSTSVASSTVTIKVSSFADENILSFIEALTKNLPGYVKISSLKLMQEMPFSQEVLNNLRKGMRQDTAGAVITFDWRALKNNENKTNEALK